MHLSNIGVIAHLTTSLLASNHFSSRARVTNPAAGPEVWWWSSEGFIMFYLAYYRYIRTFVEPVAGPEMQAFALEGNLRVVEAVLAQSSIFCIYVHQHYLAKEANSQLGLLRKRFCISHYL